MHPDLLGRALGTISAQALQRAEISRLLHSVQAAPGVRFDGSDAPAQSAASSRDVEDERDVWAHQAGVNCLTIDRFEGR